MPDIRRLLLTVEQEYARHYHMQLPTPKPKSVQLDIMAGFGTTFMPSLAAAEESEVEPGLHYRAEHHQVFIYFRPITKEQNLNPPQDLDPIAVETLKERANVSNAWIAKSRGRAKEVATPESVARIYSLGGMVLEENEGPTYGQNRGHQRQPRRRHRMSRRDGYGSGSTYDTDGSVAGLSAVWLCCNPKYQDNHESVYLPWGQQLCEVCAHSMCDNCGVCARKPVAVKGKKGPTYVKDKHPIQVPRNALQLLM